jgi:hypothetical protein
MTVHQIASLAQPKDISLRARVRFNQFGVTLAGSVVGISHDLPMRYDLRLDSGAIVANVPEPQIDAVIDGLAPRSESATRGPASATLVTSESPRSSRPNLLRILRPQRRETALTASRVGTGANVFDAARKEQYGVTEHVHDIEVRRRRR